MVLSSSGISLPPPIPAYWRYLRPWWRAKVISELRMPSEQMNAVEPAEL
jgi:hypothetical protein